MTHLRDTLELHDELARRESSRSLRAYLDRVVIDSRPSPQPFGKIAEPWQWDLLTPKVPALEAMMGIGPAHQGPRFFWDTLPRGHDKTSSIARMLNGLLAFSRRPLRISAAASDSEQAALIQTSMQIEANLNPWFGERLAFHTRTVKGPGGHLRILAADAAGSFGRTDDIVVCDEVTHWPDKENPQDNLFHVLMSGAEKRPDSLFFVITNAGVLDSWQDELRQIALSDAMKSVWRVFEAPSPMASWMTPEALERLALMLPPGVAKRVLWNQWIDAGEESGYLLKPDIEACEELGRRMGLGYRDRGLEPFYGRVYYAGIDYAPKKDRTVCCVLHKETFEGREIVVVDRMDMRVRQPGEDEVPIKWVEDWIEMVNERFQLAARGLLVVDPYQMLATIQDYETTQKVERFEARGGKANYEMAEGLRTLVVNRQIAWYPGCGELVGPRGREDLGTELRKLVLKPTAYGYRFDHTAGHHDDRAVGLGMPALFAAKDTLPTWVAPPKLTSVNKPGRMLYGIQR